ncbi:ssDNA-binding transcriptional regulator [Penicillium herquei]|nr:ssDNA-binding transcriptional regulator [Penicillium herquei]
MSSRKRSSNTQDSGAGSSVQPKKAKVNTGKSNNESSSKVDSNGDKYWEISKMRRVTVSEFRGKTMVNLREYYEKDGQELPGKKGISLPIDQFAALIKILPELEQAVQDSGESLPRPIYSGDTDETTHAKADKSPSPSKQNIEATSDEDEDEE